MELEPYLRRIRTEFPDIAFNRVEVPKQGLDHLALYLDDQWVFRFVNNPEYRSRFPNEVRLLNALHHHVHLPIPHYTRIAADFSFGGYERIHGEQLRPDVFHSLPQKTQVTIASQLAEFLTDLHGFQRQQAIRDFDVEQTNPLEDLKTLRVEYAQYVKDRMSDEEHEQCESLFSDLQNIFTEAFPLTLTHSDLTFEHILLHPARKHVAGIIDFGDKAISDPAIDFAGLWEFGVAFVRSVYDGYGRPKDDSLLQRSLLLYRRMALSWLVSDIKLQYWDEEKQTHDRLRVAMKARLE